MEKGRCYAATETFQLYQRVMEVNCRLLLAVFLAWGLLCGSTQPLGGQNHDGSTVTRMLARLGLGPGAHQQGGSESQACEEQEDGRCLAEQGDLLPADLCWGYESGCGKKKRLFVPHCEGPPKPW